VPSEGLVALLEAQPHAKAVLGGVAAGRQQLSHAYLITGPSGSGKGELAVELAAAALASPSADGPLTPEAVTDDLRTRVQRRVHPDLAWVKPSSAAGILVEDVETQVLAAAGSTPLVASRRVFVIEEVDRLNDSAANRLLKTIEEPPGYVHILLLSSRPGEVMDTIASRCQRVRLQGLPVSEVVRRLEASGVPHELARSAAGIAGPDADLARTLADPAIGQPLRAAAEAYAIGAIRGDVAAPWQPILDRATEAGARASEAVVEQGEPALEHLEGRDRTSFTKVVEERAKRATRQARSAELDAALSLTATWLRDLWVLAQGAEDVIRGIDRIGALHDTLAIIAATDDERRRAAPRLADCVELVERSRFALRVNATEALLLDSLAVQISAIAHGRPVAA
jgi:DNA polymerase-3 subunit delta'